MAEHGPRRRLLVVLPHGQHVRNFVASGLIESLGRRGHDITLVVPGDLVPDVKRALSATALAVESSESVVPSRRWRRELHEVFRTASYVQRAPRFVTYRYKLGRYQRTRHLLYRAGTRALSSVIDLERWARWIEARVIRTLPAAVALIERTRPDLVVTATFIQDARDTDVVKAAQRMHVPVLTFPASWDTLTSKGFFLVPPDALMVWGEDTARHAIVHHGYAPDRIVVTGPPHFDVYAPTWPAEPHEQFLARRGIDPRKRVILFAGTTVTYMADEPLQVRALSDLIAHGELEDCVIWYRPHPRLGKDLTAFAGLPGVYVDDQSRRQRAPNGHPYFVDQRELTHYRSLLDACDGVVTAFSTMIIEAALLGKPSLVVAFGLGDDGPDRLIDHANLEHMRDVVTTPGVTLVRSLDELVAGVRRMVRGDFAAYSEVLRKRAAEIAHAEDGRARERIVEAIERMADARRRP